MKLSFSSYRIFLAISLIITSRLLFADPALSSVQLPHKGTGVSTLAKPSIIPSPPTLNAKSYILIDADSGKVIAEKNSNQKLPPASLTKIMTLYVVSNALKNGQIQLNDTIRISRTAWKTGGSRMFLKEGEQATIKDLLKGIIVDSGNDACVAIAEHLGGSEAGFVELMNEQAKALGLTGSHFTDSTGLPHPELYSTTHDLAMLGRALVNSFPQYYHWYKQKWFTYNGIRQPNRNRLLWRDNQVDGIKTGHTDSAGFCLVSSARKNNTRLIAVVMGAPSDVIRTDDSERLLNYGFRFFETHHLYKANEAISTIPIYKGTDKNISIGVKDNQFVTIPNGFYQRLNVQTKLPSTLKAPIEKGTEIGTLVINLDDQVLSSSPLYALESVPQGGIFTRMKDSVRLTFHRWFS